MMQLDPRLLAGRELQSTSHLAAVLRTIFLSLSLDELQSKPIPCKLIQSHDTLQTASMTDDNSEALARLHIYDNDATNDQLIDDILDKAAPQRKRIQDPEQLKAHLEKKYLSPSQTFSTEWLNRLQQYVYHKLPKRP